MNSTYNIVDLFDHKLCDEVEEKLQIEVGSNGFSICHRDHAVVGECSIDGIQDLGVAQELSEMLIGEFECEREAQREARIVFG
ncbi:MAG: hypothetical protein HQL80_12825 [Magnetococcales bacterium]|nr:hypothetical protein [Magnetococcales bacterium]